MPRSPAIRRPSSMPCIASCRTGSRIFPGVESAALALYAPLQDNWGEIVIRQGHGMPGMDEDAGSSWDHVSPGYLETMGQHILRGRGITEHDTASTQNVAVVDEEFVKQILQARRGAARRAFRTRSAEEQCHLRNRWCGANVQTTPTPAATGGARCSLCRWRSM